MYDLIVAGTGFSSSFFLHRYLKTAPETARILVLERGPKWDHQTQLKHRANSSIDNFATYRRTGDPTKVWLFNVGFGGGTNCWWANCPRMLPSDFKTKTLFGIGEDWPLTYDELEPHYTEAEQVMMISGPPNPPWEMSKPYPLPPHRLNAGDKIFADAYPDQYMANVTGRASRATATRNMCCANSVCTLCPVDSKFTANNGMRHVYGDPRVELRADAEVRRVEVAGGVAKGVVWRDRAGREHDERGDIVVLGASAMFNPVILQRSGLDHPVLGRYLHETGGVHVSFYLDGIDSMDGSSSITGHGFFLYTDEHRRAYAPGIIEGWNLPYLRPDFDRWTQILRWKVVYEDIPHHDSRVRLANVEDDIPTAHFVGRSDYLKKAVAALPGTLDTLISGLPIEKYEIDPHITDYEGHQQGTTRMGSDPATSIVDKHSVHHDIRNLLVIGASTFPTGAAANPSNTAAALGHHAADHLV